MDRKNLARLFVVYLMYATSLFAGGEEKDALPKEKLALDLSFVLIGDSKEDVKEDKEEDQYGVTICPICMERPVDSYLDCTPPAKLEEYKKEYKQAKEKQKEDPNIKLPDIDHFKHKFCSICVYSCLTKTMQCPICNCAFRGAIYSLNNTPRGLQPNDNPLSAEKVAQLLAIVEANEKERESSSGKKGGSRIGNPRSATESILGVISTVVFGSGSSNRSVPDEGLPSI
jgi:hypothetical protein